MLLPLSIAQHLSVDTDDIFITITNKKRWRKENDTHYKADKNVKKKI